MVLSSMNSSLSMAYEESHQRFMEESHQRFMESGRAVQNQLAIISQLLAEMIAESELESVDLAISNSELIDVVPESKLLIADSESVEADFSNSNQCFSSIEQIEVALPPTGDFNIQVVDLKDATSQFTETQELFGESKILSENYFGEPIRVDNQDLKVVLKDSPGSTCQIRFPNCSDSPLIAVISNSSPPPPKPPDRSIQNMTMELYSTWKLTMPRPPPHPPDVSHRAVDSILFLPCLEISVCPPPVWKNVSVNGMFQINDSLPYLLDLCKFPHIPPYFDVAHVLHNISCDNGWVNTTVWELGLVHLLLALGLFDNGGNVVYLLDQMCTQPQKNVMILSIHKQRPTLIIACCGFVCCIVKIKSRNFILCLRIVLSQSALICSFSWNAPHSSRFYVLNNQGDHCDDHDLTSAYSFCKVKCATVCKYLNGFEPMFSHARNGGPVIIVPVTLYNLISYVSHNWLSLYQLHTLSFNKIFPCPKFCAPHSKGFLMIMFQKKKLNREVHLQEYEALVCYGSIIIFPSDKVINAGDLGVVDFDVNDLIKLVKRWVETTSMCYQLFFYYGNFCSYKGYFLWTEHAKLKMHAHKVFNESYENYGVMHKAYELFHDIKKGI
jgi:hypothetical protein